MANLVPNRLDSVEELLRKIATRLNANVGGNGGQWFGDTSDHAYPCVRLKAVTDVELEAISCDITDLPSDYAIAAGDTLDANITSFKLASGEVIAYK